MEMSEADAIHRFISEFGFGTLLSQNLEATRLPLILDTSQGNKGIIVGHMARANPQWKNASVQCFGVFQTLSSSETLLAIDAVVKKYEPEVLRNLELMSTDYTDKLLKAVVGFKIEVDDIHAKEKLGQHKSIEDQRRVFAALASSQYRNSVELAEYMWHRQLGTGSD